MTDRPDDWGDPVSIPVIDVSFERIMVPFDGSHVAELALAYAEALARAGGGEIIVVVAYDPPVTLRRRASQVVGDTRVEMADDARELAAEAVAILSARGSSAKGVVSEGDIVAGLLQAIDDEGADIVILGRRGLSAEVRTDRPVIGALRQLVGGSVADKLTRLASVPVVQVG